MLRMILIDWDQNEFTFGCVSGIDTGRNTWCQIAGVLGGNGSENCLFGFKLIDGDAIVYEGDYTTDEC